MQPHRTPLALALIGCSTLLSATGALPAAAQSETSQSAVQAEFLADEMTPFVGQPVELHLRIWLLEFTDPESGIALTEREMWRRVALEQSRLGLFTEPLSEQARPRGRRVTHRDGRGVQQPYFLYEISTTLIPRAPGPVSFDTLRLHVDYPQSLQARETIFGQTRYVVDRSQSLQRRIASPPLTVKPIPEQGRPSTYRGAVGRFEMAASVDQASARAGEPITLALSVTGEGDLSSVPAPPLSQLDALVAAFHVPGGLIAGEVTGGAKVFRVSLRPRSDDVASIPAIPLSYFDPSQAAFATDWTNTIPLSIQPAPPSGAGDAVRPRPSGETNDWPGFYRTEQILAARRKLTPARVLVLLAAPPVVLVLSELWYGLGLHRRWTGSWRLRSWLKKVKQARSAADVAAAVEAFAGNNSKRRVERGDECETLLADCERAQFGLDREMSLSGLQARAANCLRQWHDELSRGDMRIPTRRLWIGSILVIAVLLLYVGDSLRDSRSRVSERRGYVKAVSTHSGCLPLTVDQQRLLLREAESRFAEALRLREHNLFSSREAFDESARRYKRLLNTDAESYKLHYNLATMYYHAGELGQAIAHLEAALAERPTLSAARRALELTHHRAVQQAADESRWTHAVDWRWPAMTAGSASLAYAAAVSWWGFYLCLALRRTATARRVVQVGAVTAATCAVCFGGWLALQRTATGLVVVSDDQVVPRTGPGVDYPPALERSLVEGSTLTLRKNRLEWVQAEMGDGRLAWIPAVHAITVVQE